MEANLAIEDGPCVETTDTALVYMHKAPSVSPRQIPKALRRKTRRFLFSLVEKKNRGIMIEMRKETKGKTAMIRATEGWMGEVGGNLHRSARHSDALREAVQTPA